MPKPTSPLPRTARIPKRTRTARAETASPAPRRDYGGIGHAQRSDDRRARLLAAALQLFAQQGYAKTPIEQLCAEAKVTARHFYELFESREALLAALYSRIAEELRAAMLVALATPATTPDAQIAAAVRAMIHHYLDDARRARIGVLEVVGVSAAMEKRRRGVIHEIAALLESYLGALAAQGQLPRRNYHLASVAMVGGVNELLAEWLTVATPPSITTLTDEISLLFRALLRGAALVSRDHSGDLA